MQVKTLILGAGAAGLFCAGETGPDTLVVDHAAAPGEKIRISGGGRCNFTNTGTAPANFISANRHFCKSALARFTPADFLSLVDAHRIPWHEKTLGQLFCDRSARDIIAMLLARMHAAQLWLHTTIDDIAAEPGGFRVDLTREGRGQVVRARNLVVATGGKSIPKMGATGLAYRIAAQFGLEVTETRPALVPFTFAGEPFAALSGVALPVIAQAPRGPAFAEAMLFTHRGLSGPALLQTSSYWREGEGLTLNLAPGADLRTALRAARQTDPRKALGTVLARYLPARLASGLAFGADPAAPMATLSAASLDRVASTLGAWPVTPTGTEGYRTAEVTLGGVATQALSDRTMAARGHHGLYFIGECVDVTGWLGGYNFQWAWASAHAAGRAIALG